MKHGLGKGLDALFDMNEEENNASTIDIDSISRDPSQPRKHFDPVELEALAQSIVQNGIIQPIIVRQTSLGYTIVAGERRFRAAKQAGLAEIPIIVKDLTDLQVLEISLVENIQREDLNSIEEANAYKRLSEEFGLTQEKIAESIGKSRVSITNKLRLLGLSDYIKNLIIDGKLSEGHGRALLAIENPERRKEIADEIIKKGLNVREVEKLSKKKPKTPKKSTASSNIYQADFVVIGSGIAGLACALKASYYSDVIIITKKENYESNPNYAQGHYAMGFIGTHAGVPGALPELDIARRLSPYDPLLFAMESSRALNLVTQEKYHEAAHWAVRATVEPNAHFHIYAIAAACLELDGRHEEAGHYARLAQQKHPGYTRKVFFRSFPYKLAHHRQRIYDALGRAGLI